MRGNSPVDGSNEAMGLVTVEKMAVMKLCQWQQSSRLQKWAIVVVMIQ